MGRKKQGLTPDDVLTYAYYCSGLPLKLISDELKVSRTTIINRCNKIKEFIGREVDISMYRMPLFSLYYKIFKTFDYHLGRLDKETAFKLAEGLGILTKDGSAMKDLADALAKNKGDNVVNVFSGEQSGKDDGILTALQSIERALKGSNSRL